jgi:hypothetical protein
MTETIIFRKARFIGVSEYRTTYKFEKPNNFEGYIPLSKPVRIDLEYFWKEAAGSYVRCYPGFI